MKRGRMDKPDRKVVNGLLRLEICPPDSSRWTVAAVPKEAFDFL